MHMCFAGKGAGNGMTELDAVGLRGMYGEVLAYSPVRWTLCYA